MKTRFVDLLTPKQIHLVGIGGAGMNAIATVLAQMGHEVHGSDATSTDVVRRLQSLGMQVALGHRGENIAPGTAFVAHSTAIGSDNPERIAAAARGLQDLRRADLLASIAKLRKTLAVAGTHGKTTTSTMLSYALDVGRLYPSWVIGGEVVGREGGARWDSGEHFVVEADESDGTFLELGAYGTIVTNIEPDHLEHYGSLDDREGAIAGLHAAFRQFVDDAPGPKVVCLDDEGARSLLDIPNVVSYGTAENAIYHISDISLERFASTFTINHSGRDDVVRVHVPGMHNVRNATAAFAMACELGVDPGRAVAGLGEFKGVGRRFQLRGEFDGVTFVDEYAHLPGEIVAALQAARDGNWHRIVVVFQPHRFSRTEQVGSDFGPAFKDADLLILTDIYSAGESPREGVDGTIVARAVEHAHPELPLRYVQDRAQLAGVVRNLLEPGDLCLTVGAGDITELATEIMGMGAQKGSLGENQGESATSR